MAFRHFLERSFFQLERLITALLYPLYLLREQAKGPAGIPILMYHQVGPTLAGMTDQDCVPVDQFETQIRAILEAGYRVDRLSALIRRLQDLRVPAQRCAVLTFDDGLRDQFMNAYPILRRYEVPATFFLTIESVEGRLSWGEVKELSNNGMEIGSHSVSHPSLGGITPEAAELEIRRSKHVLEQGLGVEVDLFAYPFGSEVYGDFHGGVQKILREARYLGACTAVVGTNGRGADPFALRRIPIDPGDGPFRVRCKLVGAYNWVGSVKGLWQRLVPREDRINPGVDRKGA